MRVDDDPINFIIAYNVEYGRELDPQPEIPPETLRTRMINVLRKVGIRVTEIDPLNSVRNGSHKFLALYASDTFMKRHDNELKSTKAGEKTT